MAANTRTGDFITRPAFPPLAILALLLGLLVPVVGYLVLPGLGIGIFSQVFSFNRTVLMFGALIGGVAYLYYLKLVLPRPQLLAAFILLAWPLAAYFNGLLLDVGINVRLRPLLILAVALPSLWVTLRHGRLLLGAVPWFKYYLAFLAWLILYSFIYNANAVDPRLGGGAESLGEGSVSVAQLTAYFYCLMAMAVAAVGMLKIRDYRGLFDATNKALLIVTTLEALAVIIGYPFEMFSIILDGFKRSIGIFSHPNPFAHHMGILMVYLLGLFCYYQGDKKHRMPGWLLAAGLGINLIAFLLAFSKTALAVFALCALVMMLLNLAVPVVRQSFLKILVLGTVLVPAGLFGFELLSGQSFFAMLESRIEDTNSLEWRTETWGDLLADINSAAAWFGHGFTAANATVFRLTFNDARNAQPLMMVHNAYIALLYDLGVLGYLMFAANISMIWQSIRCWIEAAGASLRTIHSIIFTLTLYFLVVCGFDEMSYMFDAPMIYWLLATMLYCVHRREQAEMLERGGLAG